MYATVQQRPMGDWQSDLFSQPASLYSGSTWLWLLGGAAVLMAFMGARDRVAYRRMDKKYKVSRSFRRSSYAKQLAREGRL